MKEITGEQKAKSKLLRRETKVDKNVIQNPQEIAKESNTFFTSVEPASAEKIPDTKK